jgi:hypothetical protein
MPYIVQKDLNEIAMNYGKGQMIEPGIPSQQYPGYINYPGG